MATTVTIDREERVVIPKTVRQKLQLEAGDTLELESEGNAVTLRPVHAASPLRKEHGIWVFYGRKPLTVSEADKLIRDAREERDRRNLGEDE